MNEVLTSEQQREADGYTILNEPISSIDLMERASSEFIKSIIPYIHGHQTVHVFCGSGNNGGDGLAVARLLREKGINTHIYLIRYSDDVSADCRMNLAKLKDVINVTSVSQLPKIQQDHVIIDALFGTGLTRPVEGFVADVINLMNNSMARTLSIDIPSGLPCDSIPFEKGAVVRAHFTGTFERPKLAFFLPESAPYIHEWTVISIGLNQEFIKNLPCKNYYISEHLFHCKIKPRLRFTHKGIYGHGLLIAGSTGKMGAAILSAKGALRSGIGKITVHVPKNGNDIIQISVPEAMCNLDKNLDKITELPPLTEYNAIGIGPGIGQGDHAFNLLSSLFKKINVPLVLDADALNTLASHPELLVHLPPNSILTPHPKEFERIVGPSKNSIERLKLLREFCAKYAVITILKDAITAVCFPDGRIYFNITGNPGMATGGSGDVLTGIILGLLTQEYSIEDSALISVYFHGLAGDTATKHFGEKGVIASDIIDFIRIESFS